MIRVTENVMRALLKWFSDDAPFDVRSSSGGHQVLFHPWKDLTNNNDDISLKWGEPFVRFDFNQSSIDQFAIDFPLSQDDMEGGYLLLYYPKRKPTFDEVHRFEMAAQCFVAGYKSVHPEKVREQDTLSMTFYTKFGHYWSVERQDDSGFKIYNDNKGKRVKVWFDSDGNFQSENI